MDIRQPVKSSPEITSCWVWDITLYYIYQHLYLLEIL